MSVASVRGRERDIRRDRLPLGRVDRGVPARSMISFKQPKTRSFWVSVRLPATLSCEPTRRPARLRTTASDQEMTLMRTKIGIIGSGNVGAAMGRLWGLAGHDVVFSFSRDPSKLEEAAKAAGAKARAGTPAEAAAQQIVVLAVPWPAVSDAL